jgi:hypothetical protein
MDKKGITMIELVFAVSIIGILVFAGGFTYADWIKKYRIEKVAREFYTDLMRARVMAMEKNLSHFIVLDSNYYTVIEDTDEDGSNSEGDFTLPTFPRALLYTLNWNGSGNMIKCDRRGLMSSLKTVWFSIPEESETGSDFDCIIVSRTRLSLGQYSGGGCQAK